MSELNGNGNGDTPMPEQPPYDFKRLIELPVEEAIHQLNEVDPRTRQTALTTLAEEHLWRSNPEGDADEHYIAFAKCIKRLDEEVQSSLAAQQINARQAS